MKKWLTAILAAILALGAFALAEDPQDGDFGDGDFGFEFVDDGYSGQWVSVGPLGFEFCLPDGWTATEPEGGAAFSAAKDDGSAALTIRQEDEGVESLAEWGKANLSDYQLDEANFYDALVTEEENEIVLRTVISDGRLTAFDFTRDNAGALPREFALQIVGSACVLWDAGEVPVLEGDGDFDFGEAFESDSE